MIKKSSIIPALVRPTTQQLMVQRTVGTAAVKIDNCQVLSMLNQPSRDINRQLKTVLKSADLVPVLKLDEGDLRLTPIDFANQVCQRLANALTGLSAAEVARLIIVYSPSWAAECRLPADAQRIRIAHRQVRDLVRLLYDRPTARHTQIIYGGFVFENELADVLGDVNVDGVLVNK